MGLRHCKAEQVAIDFETSRALSCPRTSERLALSVAATHSPRCLMALCASASCAGADGDDHGDQGISNDYDGVHAHELDDYSDEVS